LVLPAVCPRRRTEWNTEILPAEEAIEALAAASYGAIVLDLPLPGWTTPTLLETLQRAAPGVPVLVRAPEVSVSEAVQLAHLGIYQFLPAGEAALDWIDRAI